MQDLERLHTTAKRGRMLPPLGPLEWHVNLQEPYMDRAYDYAHSIASEVTPCMAVDEHRALIRLARTPLTEHDRWMRLHHPYVWTVQRPPLMILLRGAPGSGKSTWAARYKATWPHETLVISATDYFRDRDGQVHFRPERLRTSHAWCQTVCEWLCELRTPRILVDNTNISQWECWPYIYIATRKAYRCFQHICEGVWQNRSGVPDAKVHEMRERFEPFSMVPQYQGEETGP